MPSAIRIRASAASDGEAIPSNSNCRLSPMSPILPLGHPDQRAAGPAQLHSDVVGALALLDLDLEDDELRGGDEPLLVSGDHAQLSRKDPLGELREVERGRVSAGGTAQSGRDRRWHFPSSPLFGGNGGLVARPP